MWLLRRKSRRLTRRKKLDLAVLLHANERLFRAYVVKEQFAHLWTARSAAITMERIRAWRKLLNYSRLKSKPLNAALRGNNSRIRGISQRGHGYRDPDNLMLMLYHASWRQLDEPSPGCAKSVAYTWQNSRDAWIERQDPEGVCVVWE